MVRKSETATVVTSIFGDSENSRSGGRARDSAIPPIFDGWFHGDNRMSHPFSLFSALGQKDLEEYPNRTFPNYRVKNGLEISFDTDGQTVSSPRITWNLKLSPITLEGGPGEYNPFRADFGTIDGSDNYLPADKKGPFKASRRTISINGVEGFRGSVIYGGSDRYLRLVKPVVLSSLTSGIIPRYIANYYLRLPAFYSFLDFIFMADGTKVIRVWDASRYPAHALYVGSDRERSTQFREGREWNYTGYNQPRFQEFVADVLEPAPRTPFRPNAPGFYKDYFRGGAGTHPVMEFVSDGSRLRGSTVEDRLSSPLFPSLI